MSKQEAQSHMIHLMIETLKHSIENAESDIEEKVLSSEIAKLTKRLQRIS